MGGADRRPARVRRVARVPLAPDPGLGGAGRDRRHDRTGSDQFLARVDRRRDRRRAGDWLSYWIGVKLGPSVAHVWPLSRHPDLLPRGEKFMTRWGIPGIFIGRFS